MGRNKKRKLAAVMSGEKTAKKINTTGGVSDRAKNEDSVPCKFSVDKLLEKAEELMGAMQFDLALKFCERALEKEPENETALVGAGQICAEAGRRQEAVQYLSRAVELYPDSEFFNKFLYLAQLSSGKEAGTWYLQAAEIMKQSKNGASKRELSDVFCALAELYLTDLCDEEDAEEKCAGYLDQATSPELGANPSALQTYASFLITVDRKQEAVEALLKSLELWLPELQAAIAEEGPSTSEIQLECEFDFEKRKECARLLIEVEKYSEAEQVLDTLLAEDEEDLEIWYLFGWMHYLKGEECWPDAKSYLEQTLEIAKEVGVLEEKDNEELLGHVRSLLKELKDVIPETGDEDRDQVQDMDATDA